MRALLDGEFEVRRISRTTYPVEGLLPLGPFGYHLMLAATGKASAPAHPSAVGVAL